MSLIRFKKLYKTDNLLLAWRRINTSLNNLNYKDYYREIFFDYEINLEEHLNILSKRIKDCTYEPVKCAKIYKPKSNGLLRPVTLLDIEDQIVYMACANVLIPDFIERRRKIEGKFVFSNIFSNNIDDNIFLFQEWKFGYSKYKKNIKANFNNGNIWTAHFDLASFYDSIDHESLTSAISKKTRTKELSPFDRILMDMLSKWSNSSEAVSKKIAHSIPQGPLASSVFAELFLLPIDEILVKNNILFSRYVDDIVLQAKTRNEILSATVLLDTLCKEKGLIPQSSKFSVYNAIDEDDAIGKNPSLTEEEKIEYFSNEIELTKTFDEKLKPENYDSGFLKYVLKTYSDSDCLVQSILNNFNEHYDLAEEFCQYLSNFIDDEKDQKNIRVTLGPILIKNETPYDFVQAELWKLFSNINKITSLPNNYINHAMIRLEQHPSFCLKYGLYHFLSTFDDNRFSGFLEKEDHLLVLLLLKRFNFDICNKGSFNKLVSNIAQRKYFYFSSICKSHLTQLYIFDNLQYERYTELCRLLGVAKKNIEPISIFIKRDYGIDNNINWKILFDSDYEQANVILYEMHKAINMNKTLWVNLTDCFNELLVRRICEILMPMNPSAKWPDLFDCRNSKQQIRNYGGILSDLVKDNSNYTRLKNIAEKFQRIHIRRSKTPISHSKETKTLLRTKLVLKEEFYKLKEDFENGLVEIISIYKSLII